MSNWEQALVIILSITLTVFLIVTIVAIVKIIQILNRVKRLTAKAEATVDKAESITTFFQNVAGPAALFRAINNIVQTFRDNKAKGGERRHEKSD